MQIRNALQIVLDPFDIETGRKLTLGTRCHFAQFADHPTRICGRFWQLLRAKDQECDGGEQ